MQYASVKEQQKTIFEILSALYATDVKFRHTNRPHGNQVESKLYYSGNHHLYGYKIELFVSPLGNAIHACKHYLGSVPDVTIFRNKMKNHLFFTKKKRWT